MISTYLLQEVLDLSSDAQAKKLIRSDQRCGWDHRVARLCLAIHRGLLSHHAVLLQGGGNYSFPLTEVSDEQAPLILRNNFEVSAHHETAKNGLAIVSHHVIELGVTD